MGLKPSSLLEENGVLLRIFPLASGIKKNAEDLRNQESLPNLKMFSFFENTGCFEFQMDQR